MSISAVFVIYTMLMSFLSLLTKACQHNVQDPFCRKFSQYRQAMQQISSVSSSNNPCKGLAQLSNSMCSTRNTVYESTGLETTDLYWFYLRLFVILRNYLCCKLVKFSHCISYTLIALFLVSNKCNLYMSFPFIFLHS